MPGLKTYARFTIDEVLTKIEEGEKPLQQFDVEHRMFFANMGSLRYKVFQKSLECCACKAKGEYFLLQGPEGSPRAHFNLFAIEDGKELLMTKDHILPKTLGGTDDLDNLRTMCTLCNEIKAHFPITLEQVLELRRLRLEDPSKQNWRKLCKKREEMVQWLYERK